MPPSIFHSTLLEQFATRLIHGFTTRHGGVSPEPYKSLNLALHVGDDPTNVVENRKRLLQEAGLSIDQLVCAEQVHGKHVTAVALADKGNGATDYESAVPDSDGLCTDEHDLILTLFFADCVPILLYDPVKEAACALHAGWKGTALKIVAEGIQKMQKSYGSKPADMAAAIGPAIGGCCYGVSEEVAEKLKASVDGETAALTQRQGKWHVDLQTLNREQLLEAGLRPENIDVLAYCTSDRTDLFFSHRKENGRTGRQGAFIGLW